MPVADLIAPSTALAALLENVLDYAGLFPPASLDMRAVVTRYAEHVAGPAAWMLERIIIPVARLDEFEEHARALLPRDGYPWPLSCLTVAASDPALPRDLERIAAFNTRHAQSGDGLAEVDFIEVKAATSEEIERAVDLIPEEIVPFFEIAPGPQMRGLVAAIAGTGAGAKIRTGGVTKDLYPAAEAVASFLAACAGADVPVKATASMHHPLRTHNASSGALEYGFLNFFLAAAVAYVAGEDEGRIRAILDLREAGAIRFEGDRVTVGGVTLRDEEIEHARMAFAISFGSCSFDEPVAELTSMGLLVQESR